MDINIGKVDLTEKQMSRLSEASLDFIKGLKYQNGEITVNSDKDLTKDEIDQIKDALAEIPDEKLVSRLDEIKLSQKPTLEEVVEALKIQKIL